MKPHLALVAAILSSTPARAAAPQSGPAEDARLDRSFVTIPYSELRALWEAGRARPEVAAAPAPVSYVIDRAELVLALGEAAGSLNALFELQTLGSGWETIPLLGGSDAQLEKADAGELTVLWKDGYRLLSHQPGKSRASLQLRTAGWKALSRGGTLKLALGAATVKRLKIVGIPQGFEARVDGAPAAELVEGAAVFALAGEAGTVSVELAAPRVEKPAVPSLWEVQSQTLVTYADGRLHLRSRVLAHTDAGAGTELSLVLPGNAGALAVAGEDLLDWTVVRAADGQRLLRVRWTSPDVLERELSLTYGVPQPALAKEWQIQAPAALEKPAKDNLYAIVAADGLEFKSAGLSAVAAGRLPQWMREAIGAAVFQSVEAGPVLTLEPHWLPAVATAEAIVGEAKSQMRLVADGAMQTDASYSIRHSRPIAWSLELPAGVEILSCNVGGRAARPVQRAAGVIEINLPAPAADSKTAVRLVYTAKYPALDAVSGRIALELPKTPLFIERLEWSVAIPRLFEISAVEGNVAIVAAKSPEPAAAQEVISLSKDLCRAERPAVELFYQRRLPEK